MTQAWDIDVVIGVHTTSRPIERAVSSALRNEARVRVSVVAHNVAPDAIADRLAELAARPDVRILHLSDGVRSPANAFNHGFAAAEAEYLCLVGSDDELSDGALDAWLDLAHRADADVVIAPVLKVASGGVPSPRSRRGRVTDLDGDRDRLFERASPLGLLRRATVGAARFSTDLPRGVDQSFCVGLWFGDHRIAFDPTTPPYREYDDQRDRVTKSGGPAADDLGYLGAIEQEPAFASMTTAARRALAAKIIRVHVMSAIESRLGPDGLRAQDRSDLAAIVERLEGWAPGVRGILAVRDVRALDAALRPGAQGPEVIEAIGDRTRYAVWDAVLTSNPLRVLHRHAPLRSMAAGRRVARAVSATAR